MRAGNIAVIGAGLAGLSAAYYLKEAGFSVSVFEKNSFIGGRLSSFSNVNSEVDLGAQYFTARSTIVLDLLTKWQQQGRVAKWSPRLKVIDEEGVSDKEPSAVDRWVATPTMASMVDVFATSLDIYCQHHVNQVSYLGEPGWQIAFSHTDQRQVFSTVLMAIPSPLIAPLVVGAYPKWLERLKHIEFLPTLGALVSFTKEPDFDAAFINCGILRWLASNSAKPGRRKDLDWTVHLDHEWSAKHAHLNTPDIAQHIIEAWQLLSLPFSIKEVTPFYWPQAISYAAASDELAWDSSLNIAALGDALEGGRVEGALMSGYRLSQAMINELG
ncbi:MAG: FAD-dependent oxidoreductase [Betaproteobacteria bacterium]|nr:FAD-dependent oxidoreductase [Betaproteobacteria bacterium]